MFAWPEKIDIQEKPKIIWEWADKAMEALLLRDEILFAEAEKLWIEEIKTAEFTYRNQDDCCNFIRDNLVLPNFSDLQFTS